MLWLLACAHDPRPDLVLIGEIHTLDPAFGTVEALAISGGRVVAAGDRHTIRALGHPKQRVRLRRKSAWPGFVDSHAHPAEGGVDLLWADLSEATTLQELLAAVQRWDQQNPAEATGGWVVGVGLDLPTFAGKLDRAPLDALLPERPAYLAAADGHEAWVNRAALERAGLDPSAFPDGLVHEEDAERIAALVPDPSEAQADRGLAFYLQQAASHGITRAVDAHAGQWQLEAYHRAQQRGELTVRIHAAVGLEASSDPAAQVARAVALSERYAGGRLAVDAVKVFVDGVLETGTAALLAPYADGSQPAPDWSTEALVEVLEAADPAGLRLHAHTIGDGAVRAALDAVQRARPVHRPVLAHLELVDRADVPRFASLGVTACVQPLWAWPDPWVTELTLPRIGSDPAERLYPVGELLRAGALVVGGSDWDVTSMDVLDAVEVAALRSDPEARGGEALAPLQAVSVLDMLRAYTVEGARALGVADIGLGPGQRADIVVLKRSPLKVAPEALSELTVWGTWLEGERIWPPRQDRAREGR